MLYIIEDKEVEKKYCFSLKKAIDSASKSPLLHNYKIHATKSCLPPPKEIKGNDLISCVGWKGSLDSGNMIADTPSLITIYL